MASLRVGLNKKNNDKTSGNRMKSTVSNYKKRLENVGINPEDSVEDNRNALEKLLNLEKDQNVLFDIFEILGRPQNALFTGIDNALSGGSFGEGLKEGITGETKTTGKDLLLNHTNLEDEEGKINLVDVLGLGVDIVADPLDYVLAPIKVANTAADVEKIVAKAAKKGKNIDELAKIRKAAEKGTHWALNSKEAWRPASEAAIRYAGGGIKKAAGFADKALEFGLGKMDANYMKRLEKVAKQRDIPVEQLIEDLGKSNKLGTYKNIKKGISNIVDSNKGIDGFIGRSRQYDATSEWDKYIGRVTTDILREKAEALAPKVNLTADELLKKGVNAVEANADWSLRGQDVIDRFKETAGRGVDFLTPGQAEKVQGVLGQFGIKAKVDETGRILTLEPSDLKNLYSIQDAPLNAKGKVLKKASNASTSFKDFVFGSRNYSDVDELLKADKAFFESTPELKNFYDEMVNAVSQYATKTSDVNKGLDAGSVATKDYVKHSLTDDVRRAPTEEFSKREAHRNASIAQVNRMENELLEKSLKKEQEELIKEQSNIYKNITNDSGEPIFSLNKKGEYILDNNKYKTAVKRKTEKIGRMKRSLESSKELIKGLDNQAFDEFKLLKKDKVALANLENFRKASSDLSSLRDEISTFIEDTKSLKNISPESSNLIDDLNKAYTNYYKKVTSYKNAAIRVASKAEKGTLDTLGGYFKSDEQLKGAFESLNLAKLDVTASLTKAKAAADSTYKNALNKTNIAYNQGVLQGKKINKLEKDLKKFGSKIVDIKQSASDSIAFLEKKIALETETLKSLKNAKDSMLNKSLKNIKKHQEEIELLKSKEGLTFFKNRFDETFLDYVSGAAKQNAGTKKFYDALASGLLDNEEYVKVLQQGEKVPWGYTVVKGDTLLSYFNEYRSIMTDAGKELGETLNKYAGKNLIMDSRFATALGVAGKSNNQTSSPFLKLLNSFNNTYKRFKTLTPGFHLRNITGNATNMILSGMPATQVVPYMTKATNVLNQADTIMKKVAQGVALTESEEIAADLIKQFYQAGFSKAGTNLQDLEDLRDAVNKGSANLPGKVLNKVSEVSMKGNELIDSVSRMSLLMYANDNAKYVQKLGVDNAAQAVKYALMDPSNMDDIEKNVLKKWIPFYTFTKQNLMFQATNLMKNTPKYRNLIKGINSMYNDLDEDSYYGYQKESMQIPLPFANDDGDQMFLKTNLPVSDLGEWLSNPGQRLVSSTTPLVKTPFEMVTGVNTFTGQPNNYTVAADFANALGIQMNPGVEDAAGLAEQILAGLGIDTLVTNNVKRLTSLIEKGAGNKSGNALWSDILKSMLQNTNQEKVQNSKLYEQYEAYQEYIRNLKDQGIDVPEIREINASNKNKLRNLKNKRANSK